MHRFLQYPLQDLTADYPKTAKAEQMLRSGRFSMFAHLTRDTIYGVVGSQTDPRLVYANWLRADGAYSCRTNRLNACGGLRGGLCKHLLVVLGTIILQTPENRRMLAEWVYRSGNRPPENVGSRAKACFIFHQYTDSTGTPLMVDANLIFEGFEPLDGDYTLYDPLIPLAIHQDPNVRELAFHRGIGGKKGSRTINVRIIDQPKLTDPLLEIHQEAGGKNDRITNLGLTHVICIADRRRRTLRDAIEASWQMCKICNSWCCFDCFQYAKTVPSGCLSGLFGYKHHDLFV